MPGPRTTPTSTSHSNKLCKNCGYPVHNENYHDCCPNGEKHEFVMPAPSKSRSSHVCYKQGDTDAPDCIKDNNGDVVLSMCRLCGKAESELDQPCCSSMGIPSPEDLVEVFNQVGDLMRSPLAAKIASAPRRHDNDYPLWHGPCGAGPLGGITQSMLVRFLSCRERFRLKYVLGLEPYPKWYHTFGFGNMWHVCEEAHATNSRAWEGDLIAHFNEQLELYPMQREEIVKWFNICCVQFPEYIKHWSQHPDVLNRTPLMQEQVFDVPYSLPSGRVVRLRGKFDSVDLISDVADDSGSGYEFVPSGIYLQENKTKSDIDKLQIERQLKFDLQTMLYVVALDYVRDIADSQGDGWIWTNEVKGVRYNVVRRDCPIRKHKEKVTKTRYSTSKKTPDKVLEYGKTVPAETDEHFYARLRDDYIAAEPHEWFFRVRSEVGARDVQLFRETCLDPLLETLCFWYEQVTGAVSPLCCGVPQMNYRTPFGVYSALEEGGATEYDAFLENGSELGLRRAETLFGELQ